MYVYLTTTKYLYIKNETMYHFIKYVTENKEMKKLKRVTLNYDKYDLAPSLSKDTIEYHYGKLYKGYVDRFNSGEGDPAFNEAGAYLHSIYFSQFQPPKSTNKPDGEVLNFIEKHFKSWDKFKKDFEETAMKIQGSGWVYLAKNGEIKTITNHQIKQDIVLLIDCWEHSWALDYQSDKQKYLENQWKIIDWPIINARLT